MTASRLRLITPLAHCALPWDVEYDQFEPCVVMSPPTEAQEPRSMMPCEEILVGGPFAQVRGLTESTTSDSSSETVE